MSIDINKSRPTREEVQNAIIEADEYMADHRVTESWRIISRLHAILVRLSDADAERDSLQARVEGLERIAEHRSEKIERLSAAVDAVRAMADGFDARAGVQAAYGQDAAAASLTVYARGIRAALDEHLGED